MDGADAAWVTGAPSLEQVERLGTADLADRDAVRTQSERGADKVRQCGYAVLGPKCYKVGRLALKFAGVFDQHDAIAGFCHLRQKRVGQRRLAGRCPTGNEDVFTSGDRAP